MRPLDSRLFREDATPLLNQVKLRNHVLQRVLRLMSLSRPGRGRANARRGRISYAQLGINQLGAVYEALLAYRGFFAEEDLYEVKPAGPARRAGSRRLNPRHAASPALRCPPIPTETTGSHHLLLKIQCLKAQSA